MLHAANRSTLVLAAGVGATALTFNPATGAAAGAVTGAAYDGVHTAIAKEPKGSNKAVLNLLNKERRGTDKVGDVVDFAASNLNVSVKSVGKKCYNEYYNRK